MDERDIWRAAKIFIDRYGDEASVRATMRADEMLEAGDMDGQRVWKRIAAAIEKLTTRTGTRH